MLKLKFPQLKVPKIKLSKSQLVIIGQLLIIFILGLISYKLFIEIRKSTKDNSLNNFNVNIEVVEKAEVRPCFRRKIDGICLESEEKVNLYPVAVMIENMVEAWPLSGVDKANLIIEAPVEAAIPRFLAIYASDEEIPKIGPIRSARPYYLDWAEEFRALYLHVGGSPEALQKIKNYDIFDLNQFFNDQYFWRDHNRQAPHNVYTSSELIEKALEAKELKEVAYESWLYKDEAKLEDRPAEVKDLVINFSAPIYRVTWKYNRETNDYLRYQGRDIQKMANGAEITAKNVVIQIAKIQIIDDYSRRKIWTVGEGKAFIFQDGKVIEGKWKKERRGARTKFYDLEDVEIEFNGGTTWVEVVPDEGLVSY